MCIIVKSILLSWCLVIVWAAPDPTCNGFPKMDKNEVYAKLENSFGLNNNSMTYFLY